MTPEPLTADGRPRVSDERLADWELHCTGSMHDATDPAFSRQEMLAAIRDLRDARRELAGARKVVAAQSVIIGGFIATMPRIDEEDPHA